MSLSGPQFFSVCITRCLANQLCLLKTQFLVLALGVLILEKDTSACNAPNRLPPPPWVMLMWQQLDTMASEAASHSTDLRFCFDKKPGVEYGT